MRENAVTESTAGTLKNGRRYYKAFDAIKGIVIFMVCICGHYWQFSPGKYWNSGAKAGVAVTNWFIHSGFRTYTCMELLFVLSGFQMYGAYLRIKERQEKFPKYILKKIIRIFPMTVLSTVLMIIGMKVYEGMNGTLWYNMPVNATNILRNLLNVQAWFETLHSLNGPLWYVSVYFFCLLIFYPLALILRMIPYGQWLMILPAVFGYFIYGKNYHYFLINNDMARGYLGFFYGVTLAAFCEVLSMIKKEKVRNAVNRIAFVMLVTGLIIRLGFYDSVYKTSSINQVRISLLLLITPVVILISQNDIFDKILGGPVLTGLGRISFAIYTMNFPVYIWTVILEKKLGLTFNWEHFSMFWILTAVQIFVAALIYNFYEKPIYSLARKLK